MLDGSLIVTGMLLLSPMSSKSHFVALVGHHLYRVGLPTLARLATSSIVNSQTDFS